VEGVARGVARGPQAIPATLNRLGANSILTGIMRSDLILPCAGVALRDGVPRQKTHSPALALRAARPGETALVVEGVRSSLRF
jgi:hypothetical protein